ncbi:protein kinase [Acrocarpospora sp. B8E8]|uniref:serine/threonine-protein kinase n=1 Tax=Acrocarpospora sp. B8E8 TaxID=3153572 RepID=UPI00325E1651
MDEARRLAGRYQLLEPIGRGGMGVVWRAHDELLDRAVAVKEVLYSALSEEDRVAFNRRTIREARAAGRLSHPNVVVVHDVIEEDDRPWIVMQLIQARSLGQVLREHGPLIPERAAAMGLQILDALCTAHAAGVLHRDVKPENVLLSGDNRVVLTDFGIATMTEDPGLTMTGSITGTPAFMPPERLMGQPATPESDLWSLGATIYAAVEGRSPYDRGTPIASMAAILHSQPDLPRRAGPLTSVIEGLLRKEPGRRIDAVEAQELLKQAASGTNPSMSPMSLMSPQTPVPGGPPQPASPWGPGPTGPPGGWPQAGAGSWGGGEWGVPPVPTQPRPASSNRRLIGFVLVPVLVVVLGVAGWFGYQQLAGDPGSGIITLPTADTPTETIDGTPTETAAATSPVTATGTPVETPTETATPAPSSSPANRLPPGWRSYRDELGFAIALPRGWKAERVPNAARVRFRGPAMPGYLQVDLTPWEESDPVAALETVERNSTAKGLLPKYEKISIEPAEYQGVAAADWEFTFATSAGRQRVIDRAFRIGDDCYALYWQVPEGNWEAARSYFDTFLTTFRP